jgi:thiamine biosynthesis lipoprotein
MSQPRRFLPDWEALVSADRTRLATITAPAMGAQVSITTDASPVAVQAALAVVRALEARWSRFLPESELSALNAATRPVLVSPATAQIIEMALSGRELTDGWFDPSRGTDVIAAGYRRSLQHGWGPSVPVPGRAAAELVIDSELGLVEVPEGVALDLGGLGKGWAADMASALLFDNGAAYVGVEVGGDIRIRSRDRAVVDIAAPSDSATDMPVRVGMRDGGVAVSGPTRHRGPGGRHHLIDPFTGEPAAHPRVTAIIAASAAGAEMLATAAAIAPLRAAVDIIERVGATGWLIEPNGDVTTVGEPQRFLLDDGWRSSSLRRSCSSSACESATDVDRFRPQRDLTQAATRTRARTASPTPTSCVRLTRSRKTTHASSTVLTG